MATMLVEFPATANTRFQIAERDPDAPGHAWMAGPPERLRSTMIRGIKRLPVILTP
jgi:hypothetical protein